MLRGLVFKYSKGRRPGQSTLEFTFSFLIMFLLILGMVKVFVWAMNDQAARQRAHEDVLTEPIPGGAIYSLRQVRPYFFSGLDMNAAISSNIYGGDQGY